MEVGDVDLGDFNKQAGVETTVYSGRMCEGRRAGPSEGASPGGGVVITRAYPRIQEEGLPSGTGWSLGSGLHTIGLWGPEHMSPIAPVPPHKDQG